MFQFVNAGAKGRVEKAAGCLAMLGLLLGGFLTLAAPNQARAEVANRLTVHNNTGQPINFYINGVLWIPNIPSGPAGVRDCYPNMYGKQKVLHLEAKDTSGNLLKEGTQGPVRVQNFDWYVP